MDKDKTFILVNETLSAIPGSTRVNPENSSTAKCLHHALTKFELMVFLCVL